MSHAASHDILKVMVGIERRKDGTLIEIPELRNLINGLNEQVDSYESSGSFLFSHAAYIGYEQMLEAQCQFSNEHDTLGITDPWSLDLVLPEIRKAIELLERFRTHEEQEGDSDLAVTYLVVLHRHVSAALSRRPKKRFG